VCVLLFIASDKCFWAILYIVNIKKKIINVKKQKYSFMFDYNIMTRLSLIYRKYCSIVKVNLNSLN